MIKYVSDAERAVNKLKRKKITQIKKVKFNFSSEDVAPILRGLLSENKDNKFILNFRKISKIKQKKMYKCLKKNLNLLNMKTFLNFNKNSNLSWISNMY